MIQATAQAMAANGHPATAFNSIASIAKRYLFAKIEPSPNPATGKNEPAAIRKKVKKCAT